VLLSKLMRAFEILVALFSPVFFLAGRISPRSALGQNRGAQKTAARLTVVGELPEILVRAPIIVARL
jgi:hypothetical protein